MTDISQYMGQASSALLLGIISFGVKFLRDLSRSVDQLNVNIVLIMQRIDEHSKMIEDHEDRLRAIE